MILAAALNFGGAIELLDENQPGDLMGEGEGREAPSKSGLSEKCWRQPFRTADDEGKPEAEGNHFLTPSFACEKFPFWIQCNECFLVCPLDQLRVIFGKAPFDRKFSLQPLFVLGKRFAEPLFLAFADG